MAGMEKKPVQKPASAPAPVSESIPYPVFVGELPNPHDFVLFANGGWDGNWYVGSNRIWIVGLSVPSGKFKKAYLGAKLGRMKNRPIFEGGKPTLRHEALPGEIWMGINGRPFWRKGHRVKLVGTQDIPLEPDEIPERGGTGKALEGVGESQWFWAEIPLEMVALGKENYLALWSPTPGLVDVASAPIVAAGYGTEKINTWIATATKKGLIAGAPPDEEGLILNSQMNVINVFEPAIALKLVPDFEQPIGVTMWNVEEMEEIASGKIVSVGVSGREIESAWLEIHANGHWKRFTRLQRQAPFVFTLNLKDLKKGKMLLRAAASDLWGNKGFSPYKKINVP